MKNWNERLDTILETYLKALNAEGLYMPNGWYYQLTYHINYPHPTEVWAEFKSELAKNGLMIDHNFAKSQPMDYMDPEGTTFGSIYIRPYHDGDAQM